VHELYLFASYSFQCIAATPVVVYSTDSSSRSIASEAGRLLSVSTSGRAVGYGAAEPATSPVSASVVTTSSPRCATMHGAAQAFRRVREIGAAKSVS